jgi:acyl carrier protein
MAELTREQIREILLDTLTAIAPELEPATIVPEEPLRGQVDIDSFDFLNVIIRLHERLGIDIPESDYGEFATLNRATDYLTRRCRV